MKNALRNFVDKQKHSINIPSRSEQPVTIPISAQFHIHLSEKEDADIIAWLKTVRRGYRNGLIKNITRSCIEEILHEPYFYENGIIFGDETGRGDKKKKTLYQSEGRIRSSNNNSETARDKPVSQKIFPTIQTDLVQEGSSDDDPMDIFDSLMNSM